MLKAGSTPPLRSIAAMRNAALSITLIWHDKLSRWSTAGSIPAAAIPSYEGETIKKAAPTADQSIRELPPVKKRKAGIL